ncbi:alpha/beta hydrolase [Candidatus Mycobacterium wuenschmannii]|uniref:Alpha/beta hydrolase n=1 Tax=Candidatus Mycobacterium wuenschmannii TaxID=3027808 RepID=A0ABY8W2C4_9MYCO|nr:alpha/beta hydrolase [Candidatus Mycobacterium wuenschmannii]WIM90045.1 alpha/beta hydrolase [Candidatus Mycobacterium wuenschmannii]
MWQARIRADRTTGARAIHRFELPDGAALTYTDTGQGRPVLLLHGVCMSRMFFERNIAPLSRQHRVIAVDFRSHGKSPRREGGHTVAQYARDVHALIEHLGMDGVIAIGWSMGNFVLWDYLRQFGADQFTCFVNVSQGPSDLIQEDWPIGFADIPQLHGFVADIQDDFRAFLADYIPTMFKNELPPEQLTRFVDSACAVGANAGALILIDQTLQDYRTDIPGFTVPHLLVWGRDEKTMKLASQDWLMKQLPSAESVVFDDSGHCPMWEEADRFNDIVVDWISRH